MDIPLLLIVAVLFMTVVGFFVALILIRNAVVRRLNNPFKNDKTSETDLFETNATNGSDAEKHFTPLSPSLLSTADQKKDS